MSWVTSITANYTLQPSDANKLISVNSASSVTITLPQPNAIFSGTFTCSVSNMGIGTVTVTPTSSTIDGQSTVTLEQYGGFNLWSDGSNWFSVKGIPPPALNQNVVSATNLGADMDCVLSTGETPTGGTPTDNSAIFTTFLGAASTTAPKTLIIDAGSGVLAGITSSEGNVNIDGYGWDCGLFSMNQTNAARVINNGAPFGDPHTTPPTQGINYRVRNIKVDGNRRHNGKTDGSGHWICPIDLANVEHVLIDNVWVYDPPTYGVRLDNCSDIVVSKCRFESPANVGNTDGVHIDGPATDIRISDCYFEQGDDSIALNAPEGYGGSIYRVAVTNCVFNGTTSALRAYSGSGDTWQVGRVVVSNCVGQCIPDTSGFVTAVFFLGYQFNTANTEAISDFQATNCTFQSAGPIANVQDLIGAITFDNFIWDSPTYVNSWLQLGGPNTGSGISISDVVFSNCRIRRTTNGNAAAFGVKSIAATNSIGRLLIDGFSVENEAGQSYSAIPYLIDMANMTIGELRIDNLDPTNITALVNPTTGFTGITTVTGAGLAASGFEIPDSLVPNGVQYISATSYPGHLCVKDPSGTVVQLA